MSFASASLFAAPPIARTPGAQPDANAVADAPRPRTVTLEPGHIGVTLSSNTLGVHVDSVHPADSAYKAGIRSGDTIVVIDNVRVWDHEEACELLGSNVAKPAKLGGDTTHTVSFYKAAVSHYHTPHDPSRAQTPRVVDLYKYKTMPL